MDSTNTFRLVQKFIIRLRNVSLHYIVCCTAVTGLRPVTFYFELVINVMSLDIGHYKSQMLFYRLQKSAVRLSDFSF